MRITQSMWQICTLHVGLRDGACQLTRCCSQLGLLWRPRSARRGQSWLRWVRLNEKCVTHFISSLAGYGSLYLRKTQACRSASGSRPGVGVLCTSPSPSPHNPSRTLCTSFPRRTWPVPHCTGRQAVLAAVAVLAAAVGHSDQDSRLESCERYFRALKTLRSGC